MLVIGGPSNYWGEGPTIVQITDAKGETILDSSIAGEMQRHTVRALLDAKKHPAPWKLRVASPVSFRFSGPERLYAGPNSARLGAVLDAIGKLGGE